MISGKHPEIITNHQTISLNQKMEGMSQVTALKVGLVPQGAVDLSTLCNGNVFNDCLK